MDNERLIQNKSYFKQIRWIDCARGVGMILVVIGNFLDHRMPSSIELKKSLILNGLVFLSY